MADQTIADLSRLRAFAVRVGPIVKAAVELRQLGRALEDVEGYMQTRTRENSLSRSGTPWLIMEQAYTTALSAFDDAVKAAALGDFDDLLGGYFGDRPALTEGEGAGKP